jgi:splicing factor 3B subunit 3
MVNLISTEIFGQIRKIIPFRLTGNKKDYIVVGSDSGRIVILEVDLETKKFIKIHQETFGKTGVRRIVPGEFIATDPKGRAILIAAIEKQKFVYITGRENEKKMTISSPLEAHRSHTLCFDITGLDVGYENPLFACLEVDYGDSDNEKASVNTEEYKKLLVYYEMDLGLNHVVRKNYEVVDNSAHHLFPVPGSNEGPGGVLVFCENFVVYKKIKHEDRVTPYPKRYDYMNKRGVIIVSTSSFKRKDLFFVIAQTELGDIFKLSLEYSGEAVHGLTLQYFETIPVSVSLCILQNGYLFSASETSNQ